MSPPTSGVPGLSIPTGIALGPDGNMWFTDAGTDSEDHRFISRIAPTGEITEFKTPTSEGIPAGIALGPEGDMWFTETGPAKIGRITPDGRISEQRVPSTGDGARSIVQGPEGDMWFTGEFLPGKMLPRTDHARWRREQLLSDRHGKRLPQLPGDRVLDGNLWFTEPEAHKIGRFILPPKLTNQQVPTISGQAIAGQALSVSQGAWSYTPESFSYQWQRCDATGAGCVNLSGEVTSQPLSDRSAEDVGHTLRAAVSATVLGGSTVALSLPSAVVQTVPPA